MLGSVISLAAAAAIWSPAPGDTFQYQLSGKVDTSVAADVFAVDGVETPRRVVDRLHDRGARVVCYFSAGSWEKWRPDAGAFPRSVIGKKLDGWPGESWLDVRRLDVLAPLMEKRLDVCAAKGFDAVDPDNVDGFANDSGFPLSGADQLRYNRWLAAAAHERGLAVGLKNDLGQVRRLASSFDFAVNEQCKRYRECGRLRPFVRAGKPVFHVEYVGEWPASRSCRVKGFSSSRKKLALGAWRKPC